MAMSADDNVSRMAMSADWQCQQMAMSAEGNVSRRQYVSHGLLNINICINICISSPCVSRYLEYIAAETFLITSILSIKKFNPSGAADFAL